METNTILLIILIVLVLILLYKDLQKENLDNTTGIPLSNEAIQNIASVYNNKDMTITNLKVTGTFNMIPTGTVVMWSGDINKIPTGWVLCDGTQGTPDLRGRFVLGYNKDQPIIRGSVDAAGWVATNTGARLNFEKCNQIGMNGGEPYHTLRVPELPPHTHKENYVTKHNIEGGCLNNVNPALQYAWESGGGCSYNKLGDTSSTGGGEGHNNIPPYLVLAYIMKL
jgi:microcystin-dependent protein